MTQPLRTPFQPHASRSRLMLGCGSAALALALVFAPERAAAQGILADGTVVFGAAEINTIDATTTQVDVFSPTVVIDWRPQLDNSGNALNFLRTGATGIFETSQFQNFAVLNRILPTTNGNIVVIDGSVISRLGNASAGFTPGGFVAFYSPTGILVGNNASFDVGSLLLTTLDTTATSFNNFANGGTLQLAATPGSTARIQINPGAQIRATQENSFFAVVAADVQMLGSARVNGSQAYVAGEVVNINVSNGLFNISIPVGTADQGTVVELGGTVGGPSSNGVGDNHIIYAVARASVDPISMIFRGNLGFDPAQSAGIVNGEIILSANYNVFGRTVDGGNIADGINAVFNNNSALSTTRADILLEDFTATSSLLAIGTHRTQVTAFNAGSSVTGNLLMVGRETAELTASNGQTLTVSGDVLVSAQDYGVVSSSLQSLDAINAVGGSAVIDAFGGGTLNIGGNALVAADAFAGADDLNRIAGTAQGGQALIGSTGGSLNITGNAIASARGVGTSVLDIETGATVRGGRAQFFAVQGGQVTLGGNLDLVADAVAAQGSLFSPSSVSDAFGGDAFLGVFNGGGTITIGGDVLATANAFGGSSNNAGAGSVGDAGTAVVNLFDTGAITITGRLALDASGSGGDNAGGTGGIGLGGRASAGNFGTGTIDIGQTFDAFATGDGGDGQTGGDGFGGIAGANALTGTIELRGDAQADASALGGSAGFGVGGNGGLARGGNAFFQANGNSGAPARLTIAGNARVFSFGFGGRGGDSDGQAIAAGRGGDGYGGDFAIPNQADPQFTSGAFLLAGGDYGTLSVAGDAIVVAQGVGGDGGSAAGQLPGGRGGNGFGGLAQAGLALLGGPGTVGGGSATFTGNLIVDAPGFGGFGGLGIISDDPGGPGGDGTGGDAFVTVRAGDVVADFVQLRADGIGGQGGFGNPGGVGTGGNAGLIGGLNGTFTANRLEVFARAFGGFAAIGAGGNATGGTAAIEGDGFTTTINGNLFLDASATGGAPDDGAGGAAVGGTANILVDSVTGVGRLTVTGHTRIFANGVGGGSQTAFSGGDGAGGDAYVEARTGSTINLSSAQLTAIGRGGSALTHEGGNGFGGIAELRANTGGSVTIARNVPISASFTLGGSALLNADGLGADTNGGDGIGGFGGGGQIGLLAQSGGIITLPPTPLGPPDPNGVGEILFSAAGFGGGSSVEGGRGGQASGGSGEFEADGGFISMGTTSFNVFAEGGSSLDATRNISGGLAFGGRRTIRVINGGELLLGPVAGVSATQGGDGSGTGNGGDAFGGSARIELNNGTLNMRNVLDLSEVVRGGNGARGGNAFGSGEGGGAILNAVNSAITRTPDATGPARIVLGGAVIGGDGTLAGGNAFSAPVNVTLTNTDITGGTLQITPLAIGGNAASPGGVGGNATAAGVNVLVRDSALGLLDENVIFSNAEGGDGAAQGGTATGGSVRVALDNSTIAVQALNTPRATLFVQSFAVGGDGSQVGDATARTALLELTNAGIRAGELTIESGAVALSQSAGAIGGTARASSAQVIVRANSLIDAGSFGLFSNANTSGAGTAIGGVSSLTLVLSGQTSGGPTQLAVPSGQPEIRTNQMFVVSDGVGSTAAAGNVAGQVDITVASGGVTAGELFASARGNIASGVRSQIVASGGNFNVTNAMRGFFEGDLLVRTGAGAIIGSAPVAASTTAIQLETRGTLEVLGDGSASGGLGGQSINLNAGRSILLNGNLATANGPITLTANSGGGQALSPAPVSVITMAQGTRINAGTGTVTIRLLDGAGDPQRVNGAIDLASIAAGRIDVRNLGSSAGSNIGVRADGVLTASGSGRAIDLASLNGEVINLAGDAGLVLTGGGHFGIFAATPTGSQIGSFANYARRYNVLNAAAYDALNPGGNFAAFRISPVLTVTANNASRLYGNANPTFTASFAGFQPGDGIANLAGTAQFTTAATATSNVGVFTINAALGSLLSEQGYQFAFNPGLLTITARPITVTANNLTRIYGNANPALTFTVGGQGLVNGDQLTGALATTAGALTGVGNVPITQGTLAASSNYVLTFVNGQLAITPRPITLTADDLEKLFGQPDPALTFRLSGDGLVNGDQLSGALARDPGEAIATFAIRQGTLSAGANYAVTFVPGALTINPPPVPDVITNRTFNDQPFLTHEEQPISSDEEKERYGVDFPDQPETPLISEDPLLDDPVASGGDASVYGGTGTPPSPPAPTPPAGGK